MKRSSAMLIVCLAAADACATNRPVSQTAPVPPGPDAVPLEQEGPKRLPQAVAPKTFPAIPAPDAAAVKVTPGYRVEVVLEDLTYPTSVEFDDDGDMYVAEAGYAYGDLAAPARVFRIRRD